jgi:outer membrane protein OmpA-like peptidoglycan-associated protein
MLAESDPSRGSTMRRVGAIGAVGILLMVAGGSATAASTAAPTDIPVLGSTTLTSARDATGAHATVLVNGVRRIPGATVLYFSVGLPAGSESATWGQLSNIPQARRYSITSSSLMGNEVLVDLAGKRAYSVLIDADQNALVSPTNAWPHTPGGFYSMYEVLPELPTTVTKVDLLIGNGDVVQDLPVESGVLEPAVEQTGPLPLGQGWPKIDLAAAANSVEPEKSIYKLTTKSSDIGETVTQRETPDTVTVDLSADVLFASDSAKLGSAAQAKVRAAADQINTRGAGGEVEVIGYTDNVGSAAHGDVLSKQRAEAVAKVLKPLVTIPGVKYKLEGRGERDPVASNSTAAGRRENRRVSVVFAPKAGQ